MASTAPAVSLGRAMLRRREYMVMKCSASSMMSSLRARIGWSWNAPAFPGPFHIVIEGSNERKMTLNVFVTVPRSQIKSGRLHGYRIGSYPKKPLKGNPIYKPPPGFIEITDALENTPVSPHFRLGQFRCKQEGGPPTYVVLRTRLVLKLERLRREVNELGYAAETFHVMSGYRTPWYNAAIGNVKYSRHAWGGAAAIMASYHAAFAAGGELVEFPMLDFPLGRDMIGDQGRIVDGELRRPTAPGLGLTLTPKMEARYSFDETAVYSCA